MNIIILRINEAGLFNYWSDMTKRQLKTKHFAIDSGNGDIDANYSLKFHDLTTVFYGMAIELFVCCLAFIGELIFYKCKRRVIMKCSNYSNDNTLFEYVN